MKLQMTVMMFFVSVVGGIVSFLLFKGISDHNIFFVVLSGTLIPLVITFSVVAAIGFFEKE